MAHHVDHLKPRQNISLYDQSLKIVVEIESLKSSLQHMLWHIHQKYLFLDLAHQEGQENPVLHFGELMLFLHTQCKMYLQIISALLSFNSTLKQDDAYMINRNSDITGSSTVEKYNMICREPCQNTKV